MTQIKSSFGTFATGHSRDYYRGTSFHWSGEWMPGAHYVSDDYNIDYVTHGQVLLACAKSHLSEESNEPIDFIKDEAGNVVGVISRYWDFVLAGQKGSTPGVDIKDNFWYICENTSVPKEEQIWKNTGVSAVVHLADLSDEDKAMLMESTKEIVNSSIEKEIERANAAYASKESLPGVVTDNAPGLMTPDMKKALESATKDPWILTVSEDQEWPSGTTQNILIKWSVSKSGMTVSPESVSIDSVILSQDDLNNGFKLFSNVTKDHKYEIAVTYNNETKYDYVNISFYKVYSIFYGATSESVITSHIISSLSTDSKRSKELNIQVVLNNQKFIYMYPAEFGKIKSVKDQNGLECIKTFINNTISINGVSYYYYITEYASFLSSEDNFYYTFS